MDRFLVPRDPGSLPGKVIGPAAHEAANKRAPDRAALRSMMHAHLGVRAHRGIGRPTAQFIAATTLIEQLLRQFDAETGAPTAATFWAAALDAHADDIAGARKGAGGNSNGGDSLLPLASDAADGGGHGAAGGGANSSDDDGSAGGSGGMGGGDGGSAGSGEGPLAQVTLDQCAFDYG
jgi:hypothetical protein